MPETWYIWDELSDNVRMEVDETGAVTAEYMNKPDQFGSLLSHRRSGVNSFYHFDAQGSTRQLTNDAEAVTDTYTYTAFGEPVSSSGSTTNPFRYNGTWGYFSDKETNEVYVRRRNYYPFTGRWLSADPAGFIDGVNLYGYTRNQTVNTVDPLGNYCRQEQTKPITVDNPAGVNFGNRCSLYMTDHGAQPVPGWVWEAGISSPCVRQKPVEELRDVSDFAEQNKCCTLYLFGHRGGGLNPPNVGGIVTWNESIDVLRVLPSKDWELEDNLRNIFFNKNCCTNCAINIVSCGAPDINHQITRQAIANRTGCTVCGSTSPNCPGGVAPPAAGGVLTTMGEGNDRQSRWQSMCAVPVYYFVTDPFAKLACAGNCWANEPYPLPEPERPPVPGRRQDDSLTGRERNR